MGINVRHIDGAVLTHNFAKVLRLFVIKSDDEVAVLVDFHVDNAASSIRADKDGVAQRNLRGVHDVALLVQNGNGRHQLNGAVLLVEDNVVRLGRHNLIGLVDALMQLLLGLLNLVFHVPLHLINQSQVTVGNVLVHIFGVNDLQEALATLSDSGMPGRAGEDLQEGADFTGVSG